MKKNDNNTIFMFQLIISTTTYKILRFILHFSWFISKPQYIMCHSLLVNHYIIYSNLFIPLVYDLQVNYNI